MSNTPFPDKPHAKPVGKRPVAAFFGNLWRVTLVHLAWPAVRTYVWLNENLHAPAWAGGSLREFGLRLWGFAWLTFVWVLLWGDVTWANIVVGALIALLVMVLLPLPRVPVEGRFHPLSALKLVGTMIYNFFLSSAQVAWAAVKPGDPPLGAVVRVHMAIKSDLTLTLAVDYINLVPGTMVVEIDQDQRMLYIHVFDVRKQKYIDEFLKQMAYVERQFIKTFERDDEWHPSPFHGIDDDYHHVPFADRRRVVEQERSRKEKA
ncbi:Na+/H+ antiporter subunit E [Gordonia sp. PS3]|uniref:Na(+)/H(+) antiporter subunit E n=1 Tax=Gordonia sihwensis NBRC 108236 TaxID=1223544 RepID=L7LNY7_9ACTN|nr:MULTISPECIES: Na+/H+ antiporter subunit E [Gordonia]AUH70139.1 Na+/H+ antiporter subunit E [Gordonia sp. YC-JH1]KJR05768.1 cation transporter [Gordonia sihwensis]KXT58279.1 cation transporter [Gordonia sp. QH-12]MBY4570857.1 Na+/H+ antiporter subunit E [Gordonia sihwensis]WFN92470.1 Na+/H+ antiporter subunit E [Gordonia sihwensis]